MTLPEIILCLGLFSAIMLMSVIFLTRGKSLFASVSGSTDANNRMQKALGLIVRDLQTANYKQIQIASVPPSLGAGLDGCALAFLSPRDAATGQVCEDKNGDLFWQRNIIYYLVVPNGHSGCSGGAGPGGFDDHCPHKTLIRKVVDTPPATTPTSNLETPLASLAPYLTRPINNDASAMYAEPGVSQVSVVMTNLLWFVVTNRPDPNTPGEIMIDMRAVSLDSAQATIQLGQVPLATGPFTLQQLTSVFPRN